MSSSVISPEQTRSLETLRSELEAAKQHYEEARKIANESGTAPSDTDLASFLLALRDYNAATTRYSNALIRDTEWLLRKATPNTRDKFVASR